MKKIKILLFAAMSALTFSSCSDAIDIVQDGEIPDEVLFKTTTDLQNYLNGSVYSAPDITSDVFISSLLTDELKIGPSNTGQQQGDFRFVVSRDNAYASSIWLNCYATINRVNRLLKAAADITPSAADAPKYNSILAQARTLRAYSYLRLESFFSTNMKDDNALGVIISNSVPTDIFEQLPRSTNGAVWAVVEADLAFADANIGSAALILGPNASTLNPEYYLSQAMISAIKARMYLYRGNYPLAKTNAQNAITQSSLTLTSAIPVPTGLPGSAAWNTTFYTAPSPNPYRKLWDDTARGEKIFSFSRQVGGPGGNIAGVYNTNTTNISGSPLWVVGLNLFSELSSYTNDIRRYAFIDPTSTGSTYVIDKYPGKGSQALKNDLKIFRISEMKLIIAEADARAGGAGLVTAATIVKEIRDARRFSGTATLPVYGSTMAALADILKERRVEFAFEGHRYIDLKRAGADAGVSISRNAGDDIFVSSTPLTFPITDYRFTLPIPANEVNGNPGIQQNPGY